MRVRRGLMRMRRGLMTNKEETEAWRDLGKSSIVQKKSVSMESMH